MQDTSLKMVSRRYYHSSSFKMAALFTLLLGISALLLGYFLYDFGKQNFLRETEAAIDNEIALILAATDNKSQRLRTDYIQKKAAASDHPLYLYQDSQDHRLAGNLETVPADATVLREGILQFDLRAQEGSASIAAKIHTFADGSRLLVGRDIGDITDSYEQLKLFSVVIMIFMLAVVMVSFLISTFVVRRINLIALTASKIMHTGDLSQRISVDSRWDDLSNLAQILNDLLERVEQLMQDIRDVGDNIAHDLRTPLTRLRNQLEEAQNHPASKEGMALLLKEADGMLATFHALLRIANVEKGKRCQAFTSVPLDLLLQDVVELYEPLAEENQIELKVDLSPATVEGDRDLLFQLFANLLDNALKFSPEGGVAEVTLLSKDDGIEVTFSDNGIGIDVTEYEKVFNRFYRVDKSRHKAGSGLGLSLVKAVAELHGANITLQDNHPGLRVELRF